MLMKIANKKMNTKTTAKVVGLKTLSSNKRSFMDFKKVEAQTIAIISIWENEIDRYSMEQLLQKPSANSWSLGQVYIHLWMAAKGFFFKNIQRIADGDEKVKMNGRKNFAGYLVFTFGMMPSIKIEMPGSVAVQPNQPESKEQLHKRMNEVKQLVRENAARINQLNPHATVKHPFLGYLTAAEWLQLCAIHFKHHLKQKNRIKKHFAM